MANGIGLAFPDTTADPTSGLGLSSDPINAAAAIKAAVTQPRGIRNNNPLNIEAGSFTQNLPGFAGSDGRFAQFDSMASGIAAADNLLQSYAGRGLNTVDDIINRWAPATENNTGAYAGFVADKLGVTPDAKLDMADPNVRARIISAMGQFENGKAVPSGDTSQPAANTTVDLSAARKKLLDATGLAAPAAPRGNGVPQFSTDPVGAIGTVLQEVGNSLQGKPGVIAKMKEQAIQQRLVDLKMAEGFINIVGQAQKLSTLPPDKQKQGVAVLNKIIQPVFGSGLDVGAFVGNSAIDWNSLAKTLPALSDQSKVTLLNIAKAQGGTTKDALSVLTNKDLIGNLQKADDSSNTPGIMQKGAVWSQALKSAGIPLDKVTLPQLEAANQKLPPTVQFTPSEIATIQRNPSVQRSLGLTTESATAAAESAGAKDPLVAIKQKIADNQPLTAGETKVYTDAQTKGRPINVGSIPPGYQLKTAEDGSVSLMPIQGGPAQRAEVEKNKAQAQQADMVTQDVKRALDLSNEWTTGFVGAAAQRVPGTPAFNLDKLLTGIKANIGFDRLQQMRAQSPTGGALGQVSNFEDQLLQSVMGNLEQSQGKDQFEYNLKRVYNTFLDTVNGSPAQLDQLLKDGKITQAQHDAALSNRYPLQQPGGAGAGPKEGDIAINKTTGAILIRRSGKWVPSL